jgi:Ca2+-binding EF-hand superfamily protein
MNKIVRGFILAACICMVVSMSAWSQEEAKTEAAAPEVATIATTEAVAPETAKIETPKPIVADEFVLIDVNADGSVTVEEYVTFLNKRNEENAAKGAARSTEDEIKSIAGGRYEKMDINKDGIVTREEYGAFWVK